MAEAGEGGPVHDNVILSEREQRELEQIERGLQKEPEVPTFHTKTLFDHFRQRENPSLSNVEVTKDLIDFLKARQDDAPKKKEKEQLESMLDLASELVDEDSIQTKKEQFIELRRYVIGQKKHFSEINQDFLNNFLEIIPQPYPKAELLPNNVIEELRKEDISLTGIAHFLEKFAQDNEEMQKTDPQENMKAAVDGALMMNIMEAQEDDDAIIVTVNNGEVGKKVYGSSATNVDPEKGVYVFLQGVDPEDPLSLIGAVKSVDKIFVHIPKAIEEAGKALKKIENGVSPTDDEALSLTRTLEMHKDYFVEKNKGKEKPEELIILEKMLAFVGDELSIPTQEERARDADRGELKGFLGREPDPLPFDSPN